MDRPAGPSRAGKRLADRDRLSQGRRDLYLASLTLSAVATALLIGPVAYYRLVSRRGMKEGLVQSSNLMAILGLAAVGDAVLTAVLLVISCVAGWLSAVLITVLAGCMLAACGSPCRCHAGAGLLKRLACQFPIRGFRRRSVTWFSRAVGC